MLQYSDINFILTYIEMNKNENAEQPTIVKYVEGNYGGIQLMSLSRYALGYVVRGSKQIYYGDTHYTVSRGDVFYMGVGNHYVENLPDEGRPFEQIVVYYSPELLQRILLQLNMSYGMNITNTHHCERCRRLNHVAVAADAAQFLHAHGELSSGRQLHARRDCREHQDDGVDLSDRLARGRLPEEQGSEQRRLVARQLRADHPLEHLPRRLDRGSDGDVQPFADLVQEGVQTPLFRAAPPLVHTPATDAGAAAADLDVEVYLGDRHRVHLPQYVALHQALQEGVRFDSRNLPHTPLFGQRSGARGRGREAYLDTRREHGHVAAAGSDSACWEGNMEIWCIIFHFFCAER